MFKVDKNRLLIALGGLDITAGKAGMQEKDAVAIGANLLQVVFSFIGTIFFLLMLAAGFMWMTAAGNDKKIGTAKQLLAAAVIGLVVITAAYAITAFVGDSFAVK